MKQPLNLVLYAASLGMLGVAGRQFYYAVPDLGAEVSPTDAHNEGLEVAKQRLELGRGQDARASAWDFTPRRMPFWQSFESANFTGKLPPEPEEVDTPVVEEAPPEEAERPLSELFTLVSAMRDSTVGSSNATFATIRYKPGSGVEVPEGILQAMAAGGGDRVAANSAGVARPVSQPRTGAGRSRGPASAPPTAIPTSGAVDQVTHSLFVGDSLWAPFEHIKLSRIHEDGRSAFFVRQREGADPKEEEVFRNEFDINNDSLAKLVAALRAGEAPRGEESASDPVDTTQPDTRWREQEHTGPLPGRPNDIVVGTDDAQKLGQSPDEIFKQVNLTAYRMKDGRPGLQVSNIDSQLAQRFNIKRGDVILAVNGQPVSSQAKAISVGRKLYDRGVRVFRVTMLTYGQEVTRIYHADPSK